MAFRFMRVASCGTEDTGAKVDIRYNDVSLAITSVRSVNPAGSGITMIVTLNDPAVGAPITRTYPPGTNVTEAVPGGYSLAVSEEGGVMFPFQFSMTCQPG